MSQIPETENKGEDKKVSVRALLKAAGMVAVAVFVGKLISGIEVEKEGTWLTAPLSSGLDGKRDEIVSYKGADLSMQNRRGELYTYYKKTEWVALEWRGFDGTRNIWSVPESVRAEHPDWEKNLDWRVDFLWYKENGEFPEGAVPGTSSK
ncbi:hypothetical protein JW796_00260 [Candidatus Dojkabacteria bacterium]|nr:hypothetical protein [Candidatus Dojkabacteria bacterium]